MEYDSCGEESANDRSVRVAQSQEEHGWRSLVDNRDMAEIRNWYVHICNYKNRVATVERNIYFLN